MTKVIYISKIRFNTCSKYVFVLFSSIVALSLSNYFLPLAEMKFCTFQRFEYNMEENGTTYFVIPFTNKEIDHLLYETFVQQLNKRHNNYQTTKVLVLQSSDELESRQWFLVNVGIIESLKDKAAKCIVPFDLNIALPEKIDFSWCDVPTRVCFSIDCADAKNRSFISSTLEIFKASPSQWKIINGYTHSNSLSEGIPPDVLQRYIASKTGKNGILQKNCKCVDPLIYRGVDKQMSQSKSKNDSKSSGLNSTRYYITKEHIDQFGSKWISAKDISVISHSEITLIKRALYTSPIVVPKYRFIFFWNEKSGCTYWKRVLQYIQGIKILFTEGNAHHAYKNGLLHLESFKDSEVHKMIHDDSWLKVAFVREPRERLLSAYLDKGTDDSFMKYFCQQTVKSFSEFITLIRTCKNRHWESQVRLPKYYYDRMSIGNMSDVSSFTENLLRRVGAWNSNVQTWLNSQNITNSTRPHAKNAKEKMLKWYNRKLEDAIFEIYADDYEVFGFNRDYKTKN